jgi:two-component system response regulator AtoC
MTETARLLVVSRESAVLRPFWSIAEAHAWHVESAASPWDAMERVQSGIAPHLLLLDLPRGDSDTLHILRWLHRLRPDLPVIVMCFPEDADRKREATRLGAQEVLVRPFDESALESAISRYLAPSENGRQTDIDSQDIEHLGPDAFFVCAGPTAQKLRAQAELLAEADVPVLILGEPGSGKDTVARLIHKLSVRSGFKFLKVNCADMPAELLETELFGNEGSSPFASGRATGKFERAEKGTIFLDEITEMPLDLQARLIQVLQDKLLPRKGTDKAPSVDVRILASTSANLERALAEGKLREDLYYRLSAFTVQVPPLRQRKNEIVVLLRHLMHKLAKHYVLAPREFSLSVFDACQRYSWPGNLSELEAFVKRYLVTGENEFATSPMESPVVGKSNGNSTAVRKLVHSHLDTNDAEEDPSGPRSLKSLIQSVKGEAERNAIGTALQKTGWNRKAAARLLQVSYRTLLYKIDQYHMSASEPALPPYHGDKLYLQGSTAKSNGKG